jgi:uncharacterized membrane protein
MTGVEPAATTTSLGTAGSPPTQDVSSRDRLDVVDLGRGAIMALMALDHTRTFLTNIAYNPSDLTRTFPALFFTRWVSHFCTPSSCFWLGAVSTSRPRAVRGVMRLGGS